VEVRAKRRSRTPSARSRLPLTTPPGRGHRPDHLRPDLGAGQQQEAQRGLEGSQDHAADRPSPSELLLGGEPADHPQQPGQDGRDADQLDQQLRLDQPGQPVAQQHQQRPHHRGQTRHQAQPRPSARAHREGEAERE
jgi:hypothetical protein